MEYLWPHSGQGYGVGWGWGRFGALLSKYPVTPKRLEWVRHPTGRLRVSINGLSNSFLLICGRIESVAWHPKIVRPKQDRSTLNHQASTCIHHRIQLAVGDTCMTMIGWKPTISLIPPPPTTRHIDSQSWKCDMQLFASCQCIHKYVLA